MPDEDRAGFRFDPVGMALEPGVRETVTQAVATLTRPRLEVLTHVLPSPTEPGTGFLVVEVPESPDAPHQTDGRFHGRSDTGRTTLDESEVERLMLLRHRLRDELADQMALTAAHDPGPGKRQDLPRAFLTAVPTRGHTDMFRAYTHTDTSQATVWKLCFAVAKQTDRPRNAGVGELHVQPFARRGQRIGGMWQLNWDDDDTRTDTARRAMGIGDDGVVRFLRLQAGQVHTARNQAGWPAAGQRPNSVVGMLYDSDLLWHVHAVARLVGVLAGEVGYTGSWLIGLEVHGLRGYVSERHHRSLGWHLGHEVQILDDDQYRRVTRVPTRDLQNDPFAVADVLTRSLLRNLDHEQLLDDPATG